MQSRNSIFPIICGHSFEQKKTNRYSKKEICDSTQHRTMPNTTNLARIFVWAILLCITSANGTDYSANVKSAANNSIEINKKELIFVHIVSENFEKVKLDFTAFL